MTGRKYIKQQREALFRLLDKGGSSRPQRAVDVHAGGNHVLVAVTRAETPMVSVGSITGA